MVQGVSSRPAGETKICHKNRHQAQVSIRLVSPIPSQSQHASTRSTLRLHLRLVRPLQSIDKLMHSSYHPSSHAKSLSPKLVPWAGFIQTFTSRVSRVQESGNSHKDQNNTSRTPVRSAMISFDFIVSPDKCYCVGITDTRGVEPIPSLVLHSMSPPRKAHSGFTLD